MRLFRSHLTHRAQSIHTQQFCDTVPSMDEIQIVIFTGAFLAWASMLFCFFAAIANRAEHVSLAALLLNGFAFFKAENFTEKGLVYRRRYFWSLGGFFAIGIALVAFAAEP